MDVAKPQSSIKASIVFLWQENVRQPMCVCARDVWTNVEFEIALPNGRAKKNQITTKYVHREIECKEKPNFRLRCREIYIILGVCGTFWNWTRHISDAHCGCSECVCAVVSMCRMFDVLRCERVKFYPKLIFSCFLAFCRSEQAATIRMYLSTDVRRIFQGI